MSVPQTQKRYHNNHRIKSLALMAITASRRMTLEEFLQLPEVKPANEYIDSEIIQKPMPKGRHSSLQSELCNHINQTAKPRKIAYAFPELRCTFGDRSIVPDLAVFRWQHIPFSTDGQILDDFTLPPDWTIEILSPEQKSNKVIGNILHCMKYGCQLGWFIEPDDFSILTFLPGQQPELCKGRDRLPILKAVDIDLTVAQVYDWLSLGK